MTNENWTPITRKDLDALVRKECALFDSSSKDRWGKYSVNPYQAKMARSNQYGQEQVFIVAKDGNNVIFFDDVEDQFGSGLINDKGSIECVSLFGELRFAIGKFPENCKQ